MRGQWTCRLGKVSSLRCRCCTQNLPRYIEQTNCRVRLCREKRAGVDRGSVQGTSITRGWPHRRLGRASCTAYTASAGAEGRSVVLSSPLHSRAHVPSRPHAFHASMPNQTLWKPRSSSFRFTTSTAQHLHRTAPHCAAPSLAALSPPMMLPPLSSPSPTLHYWAPPCCPSPCLLRALAPRGLGLSTRPSWCRRRNRVFYSRNPHCDGGLVQRS